MKPNHLLYLLFFFCFFSYAQLPNDCSNAVNVCGSGIINSNASGVGIQELSNSNNCGSQENNSLWLKVKINTGGSLGFTLTPTFSNITVDYDFFVFGPNVDCGNIGQAIRCSTTNPQAAGLTSNATGMSASATDTSEGPGAIGNSFVSDINVLPNEEYFIVIDRPIGASTFDLEWTGSATFFDPPEAFQGNDLLAPETPNSSTSEFDLSQNTGLITGGNPDVSIAYYESLSDAVDQSNPLPNLYQGADNQTIYARVTSLIEFGCYEISEFKLFIGVDFVFPNFFTPNADGFHDRWKIKKQQFISNVTVQIFDRYGKLLKILAPDSPGWDGTFNGNQMPSSDYWFKASYSENGIPREATGHFTLKR